ncbi:MAG: alpha/beta-hydrolase family protein [Acidimicrobiia bacterium]
MSRTGANGGGLSHRTEQTALGVGVAGVPLTFQRTLMPRSNVDQAIVTGFTLMVNHAIASVVQDAIAAGAVALVGEAEDRDGRWGRATLALDVATMLASMGLQRVLAQRPREPMARSVARTGAWFTGVTAGAGALVGGFQELRRATGRESRVPVAIPVTVLGTAATEARRRRLARLDDGLAAQPIQAELARSLAMSAGVTAAGLGFSAGTRALSNAIADQLGRRLPGPRALWRPVGRLAVLGGIAAVTRAGAQKILGGIERQGEATETAFDLPPPAPEVSGSFESLVPFETLAREGRRFAWNVLRPAVIEATMDEPAIAAPIRAYVGLESAPSEDERVALAMAELERTGAFDRAWLMFASPTGTGYVNYAAAGALECLARGDCATVGMQYSARPSVLSLDRVSEGRHHARKLIRAIGERIASLPEGRRPKFVVFGESLGAWTSQDSFAGRGTAGLVDDGVDHAIWIGSPYMSKWKEQVLHDDGPDIDRRLIGVFDNIGEWDALPADERAAIRYVMITHGDDGVALFGPDLFLRAPEWLGPSDQRPARVPRGMRWTPTTGFFQLLVDMKNSANVVPGKFEAKGHDYRLDLVPFFNAVLGFGASAERVERIRARLETQELNRSQWIASHKAAGSSLAAAVAMHWMDQERKAGGDPDAILETAVRELVAEMNAEAASS